jgi:hypothetical protein
MALNNPSLSNHPLMRNRTTAQRHNHKRLCKRKDPGASPWRNSARWMDLVSLQRQN